MIEKPKGVFQGVKKGKVRPSNCFLSLGNGRTLWFNSLFWQYRGASWDAMHSANNWDESLTQFKCPLEFLDL